MIRENFVEELRENLNLSRSDFNEMSQYAHYIPTEHTIKSHCSRHGVDHRIISTKIIIETLCDYSILRANAS